MSALKSLIREKGVSIDEDIPTQVYDVDSRSNSGHPQSAFEGGHEAKLKVSGRSRIKTNLHIRV